MGRIESYRSKWQTVRYIPSRNRGVLHICKNLPGIALCWARHEACCPKRLGAQHPEWCILPLSVDKRTQDRADRPEGRMCLGIADFTVWRNVYLLTTWHNHRLLPNQCMSATKQRQLTMLQSEKTVSLPAGHAPISSTSDGQYDSVSPPR